jgi:hypothetical protein
MYAHLAPTGYRMRRQGLYGLGRISEWKVVQCRKGIEGKKKDPAGCGAQEGWRDSPYSQGTVTTMAVVGFWLTLR